MLNEYNFLQINSQKLIYASFKVKCESFITLKEVFNIFCIMMCYFTNVLYLKNMMRGDRYEISHYSFLEDAYYQKAVEFYNKQLDVDF